MSGLLPSEAAPFIGACSALRFHRCTYDAGDIRQDDYILLLPTNGYMYEGRYLDVDGVVWIVQRCGGDNAQAREITRDKAERFKMSEFEETLVGMIVGVLHIEHGYAIRQATGGPL